MAIDNKIRNEKIQYDINTEAAKTSALSSGIFDKQQFLTEGEILPSDQSRIKEQAIFTYSIRKNFWKTEKSNWRSRNITNWIFNTFKTRSKQELESAEGRFPKNGEKYWN